MDSSSFNLVNHLLFPTPGSSYQADSFDKELIWLPKSLDGADVNSEDSVPCLFLPSHSARFFMIYLHSNAEDLGRCHNFCQLLCNQFQVHVLAVEYPGYGLCPGGQATEESVIENARLAFRFLTQVLMFPQEDIIIIGRSIGCGPALCLAAENRVYGLVLICPFLSVRELVRTHLGPLAELIDERFPNKDRVTEISAALLLVHGKKDNVVPWTHGQALYHACPSRKRLVTPAEMSHNSSLHQDPAYFVLPMLSFFGLPDYNFDELRIPPWIYGRNTSPTQEESADDKEDSEGRNSVDGAGLPQRPAPARLQGPGIGPGSFLPKPSGSHRARPHLNTKSREETAIAAVDKFFAAREASLEVGDPLVSWPMRGQQDAFEEEVEDIDVRLPGSDSEDCRENEPPQPPDDAGFFKVPRSRNSGPTLTAPVPSGCDVLEDPQSACGWAPTWMPALCSMGSAAPSNWNTATTQELITVVREAAPTMALPRKVPPPLRRTRSKTPDAGGPGPSAGGYPNAKRPVAAFSPLADPPPDWQKQGLRKKFVLHEQL